MSQTCHFRTPPWPFRGSVHRLLEALRVTLVPFLAREAVLNGLHHGALARKRAFVEVLGWIPQLGTDQRSRALGISALDRHDDNAARDFGFHLERLAKLQINPDHRSTINAERATDSGYKKEQRDAGIAHQVAQRVDPVIAAPVRQHDRMPIHNAHEAGGRRSRKRYSAFFFSGSKSPDGIEEIDAGALLATATVINYSQPNSTDYSHSYVFETILVPPHQVDDTGTKRQLLNNYICRDTNFTRTVRGRNFEVSGFYYCQQNALVHVCAHACLRMALNSIDGSSAALSSVEINQQLGLARPLAGLSLQNINDVIISKTSLPPVLVDCSIIPPADYLSILTAYIESGFIVLFVFTT
jgi:hypothetical protein